MTVTTVATKSARRSTYEARVAEFIAKNGPDFRLVTIAHIDVEGTDCDCCGKRNIHSLYVVEATATGARFVIGCECQLFVLGVEKADLNAAFIRQMPRLQLERLALALGLAQGFIEDHSAGEIAAATLKQRRHLANKRAWASRKAVVASTQLALIP